MKNNSVDETSAVRVFLWLWVLVLIPIRVIPSFKDWNTMPWQMPVGAVSFAIVLPLILWQLHKRWPKQISTTTVIICLFAGMELGHWFWIVSIPPIDENFGKPLDWRAHENFPIVLESRLETGTKSSPIGNGITTYSEAWLYLHMNGETFKCKYWHSGEEEMSGFLYTHAKRKIELAEITASFARGEQAIHKNRLRYCSIEKMRFKHFADVEYIAASVADSGLQIYGNRPYPEYLQTYKEYFFQ